MGWDRVTDKGRVLDHAGFIWSVADLLRGDYKQSEYGKVVLPLTVLRRLDCVLAPTKAKVLDKDAELEGRLSDKSPVLNRITGVQFHNASPLDIPKILDDPRSTRSLSFDAAIPV
jgi:type I restriction enzyme M protein